MILSSDEINDLKQGVVFANTPRSLLSWLERHPAVRRLSTTLSEDELLREMRKTLSRKRRSAHHTALAYALLVAIILRRRELGQGGDLPVDCESLKWAALIWDRAGINRLATSTLTITASQFAQPALKVTTSSGPAEQVVLLNSRGNPIVRTGS